jgi:cytoskeletal protein CcmA (bactofilin family)
MEDLSKMFTVPDEGTRISPNIVFKGRMEISGNETVLIKGTFEGEISAPEGTVFVDVDGTMRGSVIANKVVVAGTVEANGESDHIEATSMLAVAESGSLSSNEVHYGTLAMAMGATIQGSMRPLKPRKQPAAQADQAVQRNTVRPFPSPVAEPEAIMPAFLRPQAAEVSRNGTDDSVLDPLPG